MKNYEYHSQLAPYISGLIRQKRADGYSYEFEAYMLEHFDQFCIENGYDNGSLTRDLVMAWAEQRPTESKNYRNQRVSFVRQLALYMISLNMDAYIPRVFESNAISVPHILSLDEIHDFYKAVDSYLPCQLNFQRFSLSYSVLFRLFYCCGLRLSEGCYLKRSAVNFEYGCLSIYQSKGHKDRVVFMSEDMLQMCRGYDRLMQKLVPDRVWFFPGRDESKPFLKTSIDKKFREFWNMTPYAGKVDKKPTVHSLRHTYVVTKMNDWMNEGKDFGAMMPYLSRYLGHTSIDETQYYYHQVVSAFEIVRKHDSVADRVIPEVAPYEE
ncbi:MAG: tyrosine-type recombinase/integrase [Ignavibacterium sp.]|nr:tyrosine-type recombinase/integrase [Ignavibacterium sp.]